jgi:hypothetical protein
MSRPARSGVKPNPTRIYGTLSISDARSQPLDPLIPAKAKAEMSGITGCDPDEMITR